MSNKKPSKERVELRVPAEFIESVNEWRRKQPRLMPFGTAVKELVEIALKAEAEREAEAARKKS